MKFVFFLVVITALVFSISAKTNKPHGRIFNGQDAVHAEFKFMAFLVVNEVHCCGIIRNTNICAGAIIFPNWVLTAAHCLDGAVSVIVYLGATVAGKASITYTVSENFFAIHPLYYEVGYVNDIALIQIPKTVECDEVIYARLPLRSADYSTELFANKIALIMGWGQKGNSGDLSKHLQKAQVTVMHNEECKLIMPFLTDMDLCVKTTKPYKSICRGDSGGPLVLRQSAELIGVASIVSPSGCESGVPNIFMRVTSYLPWIIKITGG